MYRSVGKCWLLFGIIVVFVVAAGCPAQAAWWTKYYRFVNETGSDQYYARAILQGLESVTDFYSGPSPWARGSSSLIWLAGVPSTAVISPQATGGGLIPNGKAVMMGWHCTDASCRLRDLRWLDAAGVESGPVIPTDEWGVPGGGFVIQIDENTYECWMCNDTGLPLQLVNVEFGLFEDALAWWQLVLVGDEGMAAARADMLMIELRDAILEAEANGDIPSPGARGLVRKVDKAEEYKHKALAALAEGDWDKALFYQSGSLKAMDNFIKEMTNQSDRGNVPPELYDEWLAIANNIIEALAQLLDGAPEPPVPGGVPDVLAPGECISFQVTGVPVPDPGQQVFPGLVLHGTVFDGDKPVLEWVEQATITPDMPTAQIVITDPKPFYLWSPDHKMWDFSAADLEAKFTIEGAYADWHIGDVISNQAPDATGDGSTPIDWIIGDDGKSVQLRAERAGDQEVRGYAVIIEAIDADGNAVSDQKAIMAVVDHDQGE